MPSAKCTRCPSSGDNPSNLCTREIYTQMLMILYDRWLPSRQGAHTILRLICIDTICVHAYVMRWMKLAKFVCFDHWTTEEDNFLRWITLYIEKNNIPTWENIVFIIKFKLLKFLLPLCVFDRFSWYKSVCVHEDVISVSNYIFVEWKHNIHGIWMMEVFNVLFILCKF